MATINLGNVVGLIRSSNPPLEADGVTQKTYVLWAKIIAPNVHELRYYNFQSGNWELLVQQSTSNKVSLGNYSVMKHPNNSNLEVIEAGDFVEGWFSGTVIIKAIYNGGGLTDINNFNIIEEFDLNDV